MVALTNNEFNLLGEHLLASPQRVLSGNGCSPFRRCVIEEVFDQSIDVQISRLREEVKSDHNQELVAERGAGYMSP